LWHNYTIIIREANGMLIIPIREFMRNIRNLF
jgi:hypothetical protein